MTINNGFELEASLGNLSIRPKFKLKKDDLLLRRGDGLSASPTTSQLPVPLLSSPALFSFSEGGSGVLPSTSHFFVPVSDLSFSALPAPGSHEIFFQAPPTMIGSQKQVINSTGCPTPTALILSGLKADFKKLHNVLSCSRCQTTGKIVSNGSTSRTGSPQFKCKCDATFTASSMQSLINAVQHKIPEVRSASEPVVSPSVSILGHSISMADIYEIESDVAPVFPTVMPTLQDIWDRFQVYDERLSALEAVQKENIELHKALATANATIARLTKENVDFSVGAAASKYATIAASVPVVSQADFPSLPASPTHHSTEPTKTFVSKTPRKRAPTARAIAAVVRGMTIKENADQGFQIVYVPNAIRLPISTQCQRLRKLKIDNACVLDLHYPDRKVMGMLVHNEYAPELKTILASYGVTTLDNFDPLDPVHLHDPALASLSLDDRATKAIHVHNDRMLRAIEFIRAPVKFAVARSFCSQGWISDDQLAEMVPPRPTKKDLDISIHTASITIPSFSDL
ncbi:hypothetical protein PHYBLDRAFT_172989 [Phycomyces blakesleeanus NRRL 1555(-)]|uniref:Uncharacterized protein n=1 Tax=Phycomyces blakesleeanus (strain ATCC 8743b / DSM 1359 / FGSC 10004 / NBRC 33097 / NRRL 1555) TaxID=763407 RepID=A0A167KPD3_PHYB8|nr:hypothetical protein PHYBLDRAFT_172989 [Phycomyces blakesleeanus NRRL 1555(-)]OAD68568.1 hypothetical protein PHYBLDRAFT_172989 [Phycomyces blakesleeanus NRRL 1555(-)]|eukprot:XP_018286608.1 hypothetical protein PHYBLDRAFT_172989 [Phycomyces blakesleeanus NRRL 1555(-)]